MSDRELIDAVAHVTGEDSHEIRRRGFMLAGPEESGSDIDPECMLDLIDLTRFLPAPRPRGLSGRRPKRPTSRASRPCRTRSQG
jgi:hypothetical protein